MEQLAGVEELMIERISVLQDAVVATVFAGNGVNRDVANMAALVGPLYQRFLRRLEGTQVGVAGGADDAHTGRHAGGFARRVESLDSEYGPRWWGVRMFVEIDKTDGLPTDGACENATRGGADIDRQLLASNSVGYRFPGNGDLEDLTAGRQDPLKLSVAVEGDAAIGVGLRHGVTVEARYCLHPEGVEQHFRAALGILGDIIWCKFCGDFLLEGIKMRPEVRDRAQA